MLFYMHHSLPPTWLACTRIAGICGSQNKTVGNHKQYEELQAQVQSEPKKAHLCGFSTNTSSYSVDMNWNNPLSACMNMCTSVKNSIFENFDMLGDMDGSIGDVYVYPTK